MIARWSVLPSFLNNSDHLHTHKHTITNTRTQKTQKTHLLIAHNDCKVKRITLLLCEKRRRREGWRPHELVRTQGQIPGNQLFMKYELSNQRGSNNNLQFLWLLAIYSDIKLIRTDEDSGYLAINAIRDFYLSNADNDLYLRSFSTWWDIGHHEASPCSFLHSTPPLFLNTLLAPIWWYYLLEIYFVCLIGSGDTLGIKTL